MQYFYDTNVLLSNDQKWFHQKEPFFISSITIEELEQIKNSETKNPKIKYLARKATRWLINNPQKYNIILYNEKNQNMINDFPFNIDSPDKKILATFFYIAKTMEKYFTFLTYDFNCQIFAHSLNEITPFCQTQLLQQKTLKNYDGYSKIFCSTDEELANFYTDIHSNNILDLNINEYLLVYDKNKNLIDKYKHLGEGNFKQVKFSSIESKMFGKIKPIDPYQELAIDSLKTNQITLIKGAAGTGKSLLSLAYLFHCLEKGDINRIIIFCNTVATAGSARLGFYPGDRTEKLLDSQIGNFLISKLGAKEQVEKLIDEGLLILLPMSDIRGFDTSDMKAGVYITQAQNLNIELLKLALQRIGEDSICILDGDNDAQVDLNIYAGDNNGLKRASQVFRNHDIYGEVTLKTIHRSHIAEIASHM